LAGIEPATSTLPTGTGERGYGEERGFKRNCMFFRIYDKHLTQYYIWIEKRNSECYAKSMKSALKKLFKHLRHKSIVKPIDLLNLIKAKELNEEYSVKGFRSWLIFCEEYELLDDSIILLFRNKLKLPKYYGIDNYIPSKEQIKENLINVKDYCYESYIVVRILIESGLRVKEVIEFLRTYDKGKIEVFDNFVVYPLFFLRGNKTSYYIFFSRNTFEEFKKLDFSDYNIERLKTYIKRHGFIPLKYMRKFNFTLLVEADINFEIANFIQGRASKNIGFNHYLAKKQLAVKEYEKVIKKF